MQVLVGLIVWGLFSSVEGVASAASFAILAAEKRKSPVNVARLRYLTSLNAFEAETKTAHTQCAY
jgi:hypothetical protein